MYNRRRLLTGELPLKMNDRAMITTAPDEVLRHDR